MPPAAGWNQRVHGGNVAETQAHTEQKLGERHRYEAANHSQNGIDDKLERMDQLVLRNLKERIVAKNQTQYQPGSCGRQHDGAQHGRIEIADDFFERKHHSG